MSIETRIKNLYNQEELQSLLVEEIGFEPEDRAVFFDDELELQSAYRRPSVIAGLHGFFVLVLPAAAAEGMLKTRQRQAVEGLRLRYPHALFIFADFAAARFHWIFPKPAPQAGKRALRRMEISADARLHTIVERISLLENGLAACTNAAAVAALVEKVFDVEAVSKSFFTEYQAQYRTFKSRIQTDNRGLSWACYDDKLSRYVQLLLGRIMFLHFIEKKNWLDGNPDFIRVLFEPFRRNEQSGFHLAVLEPLFFAALGKEGRHKAIAGVEYNIPFLNGGLFEARPEFGEDDPDTFILVEDELYASLLAMLGRYNFTVDESTPLDQTVGIDPEMLGKVFENLLEAEARHSSGTYYTPRSIVEFICRETLFRHCHAQTQIGRHDFHALFDCALEGRKPEIDTALAQRLDAVLDRVTVLDPAVGSGAFLLGMLQEILALKESLARAGGDSEERILAERAKRKAAIIHESLYAVDISFPAIEIARLRLWLALVVDEAEPQPLPNLDYHILRGNTLKTLLDGKPVLPPRNIRVDGLIPGGQGKLPMAGVQMTLGEAAANPHTEALLRHLGRLYSANGMEKVELRKKIRAELTALIETHWTEQEQMLEGRKDNLLNSAPGGNPQQLPKPKLKQFIESENWLGRIAAERRALRESRDRSEELELPFTPLHLYFAEVFSSDNPGFDIVIANPPYVRHEEIKDIKPQLEAEFPAFYCGTADLYTYFYQRGLELLKTGGHLCFIAPNKFMRAGYGANTRKLLTTQATPKVIIDFGDTPVFDATTYPAVVLVEKIPPNLPLPKGGDTTANPIPPFAPSRGTPVGTPLLRSDPSAEKGGLGGISVTIIKDAADIERVGEVVAERGFTMQAADLRTEGWTLESPTVLDFLNKLRQAGIPLGRENLFVGIKTGLNDAFVINAATRDQLIVADPNSTKLIQPWLRGRDIRKWRAEWAGLNIIAIASGANREWVWSKAKSEAEARRIFAAAYPAIHAHLSQWEVPLRKRDDQGQYWWELRSCAYYAEFMQQKIVVPDLSPGPRFAIESKCLYPDMTAFVLSSSDPYLLGILNSALMEFFFLKISASVRGETFRFKKQYMEQLPIFPATDAQKSPITQRVLAILANPTGPDVPRLEAEIDELVFDLYGLTQEEIALIEAAS